MSEDIINSTIGNHESDQEYIIIDNVHLSTGLYEACKSGDLDLVNMLIEHGVNDWNMGLYGACQGDHAHIFRLMVEKGAYDWDGASDIAHKKGHLNIIKLLIENGMNDFNFGLYRACESGHLNVVEYMIECGAHDFNTGLYNACVHKHLNIIKLMIEKGANHWYHIILYSFELIDSDLIDLMIKKEVPFKNYFKYPVNEMQIFKLLELGFPIDNLKDIIGFSCLMEKIRDRRNTVKNTLFDYLVKDLAEIVAGYVIN